MKKPSIKSSRKFLEKNKVFFEVFSYVILGLASIWVAILSNNTAKKQLEFLDLDHKPIINIQRDYNELHEFIRINNVGHHLSGLTAEYTSYLRFEDYKVGYDNSINIHLKVADYFNLNYKTENTTGQINSISSPKYLNAETNRIQEIIRDSLSDKFDIARFEHLLKVNYRDLQKESHSKFYKIDDFSTIEIGKKNYDSIMEIIETQNSRGHYYLSEIDTKTITDFIKMNSNN